jgi:hypothetical protein
MTSLGRMRPYPRGGSLQGDIWRSTSNARTQPRKRSRTVYRVRLSGLTELLSGLTKLPKLIHGVRKRPSASHFLFSESGWPFPVLLGAFPSFYKPLPWACSWCDLPKRTEENTAQAGSPAPRISSDKTGD